MTSGLFEDLKNQTIDTQYFTQEELSVIYSKREMFDELRLTTSDQVDLLSSLAGIKEGFLLTIPYCSKSATEFINSNENIPEWSIKPAKYTNLLDLFEVLNSFDIFYVIKTQRKEDIQPTDEYIGNLKIIGSKDEFRLSDKLVSKFIESKLSDEEMGNFLGYPNSCVEAKITNTEVSKEEQIQLFYIALCEIVENNPQKLPLENLPILYLQILNASNMKFDDSIDSYKWFINHFIKKYEMIMDIRMLFNTTKFNSYFNSSIEKFTESFTIEQTQLILENMESLIQLSNK